MSNLPLLHGSIWAACPVGARVLDVGGAQGRYHAGLFARGVRLTVLDAYGPYLDRTDDRAAKICGDARIVLAKMPTAAYDAVIAIDVIEHFEKSDAVMLIRDMLRIAAVSVVLFTPDGYHPQDADPWGLGGDHWQRHRSEWSAADLQDLGFTVARWPGFHQIEGQPPGALFGTGTRA